MDFSISNPPPSDMFDGARRIDVKPRSAAPARTEGESPDGHVHDLLHFSCPACLHMLGVEKKAAAASLKCPECSAWVMPPQLVSLGTTKATLPPPKKSGGFASKK